MEKKKAKYKLFIPGPVNTSKGMEDICYFRDSNFTELVLENEKLLMSCIGCKKGRVIPYTCSGTGGMDAMVTNLISENDKVLVIDGGTFGHRWYEICNFYRKNVVRYPVEFGKDIDFKDLTNMIDKIGATVVLIQHHETSSGQLYAIKQLGEIVQVKDILLVVDAICSFLSDPYKMDEYGVDVTLISTQKGLRLDAGMAFVILNEKAINHSEKVIKLNYYNNFDKYLSFNNLGRGHTPFTPAVRIVYQLNQKLQKLDVEKEIKIVNKRATTFRNEINDLPLTTVAKTPANFLTGLIITAKKYNTEDLNKYLKERGMFICPTTNVSNYLKNSSKTYFRVAHIGCDIAEHKELVKALRRFFK